jgi:hypothetical protein
MTERSPTIPTEAPEAEEEQTKRPVGRPSGTGYGQIDAPLHEQMRQMLQRGLANSRTSAAKKLAGIAYGHGTWESKVKRLVRSFRR